MILTPQKEAPETGSLDGAGVRASGEVADTKVSIHDQNIFATKSLASEARDAGASSGRAVTVGAKRRVLQGRLPGVCSESRQGRAKETCPCYRGRMQAWKEFSNEGLRIPPLTAVGSTTL